MLKIFLSQFRMLTHTIHVCTCGGLASTDHSIKKRQLGLGVTTPLKNSTVNNIHNHQKAVEGGRTESVRSKHPKLL